MKQTFKGLSGPLILYTFSIIGLINILSSTDNLHFSLGKIQDAKLEVPTNPLLIKLGHFSSGKFSYYTKWNYEGESIGPLPVDLEIKNSKGEILIASSQTNSEKDFIVNSPDELNASVKILDFSGVSGAEAVLVISPEKTWWGVIVILFSFLGMASATLWIFGIAIRSLIAKWKKRA